MYHELNLQYFVAFNYERLNLSLGEIGRTRCGFDLPFVNEISAIFSYMLVINAGLYLISVAIGKLNRNIRFDELNSGEAI